ncbi:hypothetical protein BIW11_11318 [Tropilaelaps mercedesae]|uniref:Uncharacterized protein n=1 Tax=Tropilaelaps mercedesae TaxID=418985 RepID=A0A1V9XBL8_9ACAR|nr:hypothetical protein BIW11_11318 [Tropilaelaps mercedesae]
MLMWRKYYARTGGRADRRIALLRTDQQHRHRHSLRPLRGTSFSSQSATFIKYSCRS